MSDIVVPLTGKSPYFQGLEDQAGPVLLEDPTHLVDTSLGTQPLSSPSRSSPHSQGSEGGERFSRKVFVGGLPPDIDEDEITVSFRRFGPLVVDWPHKAESKSYFPPKGYAFLLFQVSQNTKNKLFRCFKQTFLKIEQFVYFMIKYIKPNCDIWENSSISL